MILVGGIGNVLMGDDGFGVEVVRRLLRSASRNQTNHQHWSSPPGVIWPSPREGGDDFSSASAMEDESVKIVDFGIRGFDLAFALSRAPRVAILIDAAPRGKAPGTITVLEPENISNASDLESMHGVHPVRALELAKTLGGVPETIRIVVCEPDVLGTEDEPILGLSVEVERAIPRAMQIVDDIIAAETFIADA